MDGYFAGGPTLAEDTSSCRNDAEAGFTPLYDGRSPQSRQWRTAGAATVGEQACETWADGTTALRWYATEHLPADYTLRLDWNATTQDADSGVFLGFPNPGTDPGVAAGRGIEIQIRPSGAGVNATGAVVGLRAPTAFAARPVGQWNSYEIAVAGKRVLVRLNGVLVNDYVVPDPSRLLGSAFIGVAASPGGLVRFRNIRVRADQPATRFGVLTGILGKCVDVMGYSQADGAWIQLWPCHGDLNQAFTLPGDGTVRVMGKCLDGDGPAAPYGTGDQYAQLWRCTGSAHQQWVARPEGTLYYPDTDRCLDAPATADGTRLYLHSCHGLTNQQWTQPALAPSGTLRAVLASRLVACWPADDGSGTVVTDTSGNAHPATLNGSTSWTAGHAGGALNFDGSTGYASAGTPLLQTDRSFTVAAWVRLSRTNGYFTAVSQDGNRSSSFYLQYEPADNRWALTITGGDADGPTFIRVRSAGPPTVNLWTHLVGV